MDMKEALMGYGKRSVMGLEKGARDVREMADALRKSVPPEVDKYAAMAAELMPGYDAYESVRHGDLASREFRKGNIGSGLMALGDSINSGADNLLWFVPGMGLVKVPK